MTAGAAISAFFTGLCAVNCVPHLAAGLRGKPFPTPFAKPPGIGNSPPLVNALWGLANLGVATVLLVTHPIGLDPIAPLLVALAGGALQIALFARHYARVRRAQQK